MIPSQRGGRVARGCRRASAGLAGNLRSISARGISALALAFGFLSVAPSGGRAQQPRLRAEAEAEDLKLSEAARKKAEALGLYFKGLMLESALKIPEQITCYLEVLRLDPANSGLAMETANLCAAYGRFDEARKLLEDNLALNSGNPAAYMNLSRYFDTYSDADEAMMAKALALAEEALERFPGDANVCAYLAGILIGRGMHDEAREAFEQTISLADAVTDAPFWLRMGSIARKVLPGDRERVNDLYRKALDLAEGDLEATKAVGDYFSTTRQFEDAGKIYEAIIAGHPDALEVRERYVHILRIQGEKDRALEVLEALVAIDPVNEKTRQLLAEFYQERGDRGKAIAEFEQILRMKDGGIEDYEQLADQMIEADLLDGAEALLVRARLRFPNSTILSHKLAIVLSHLDRPHEALAQWDQTAEMAERYGEDILSAMFYHYYGAAADAAKQYDRAADYFRKAIDLVRESGDETGAAVSLNYLGYMWLEQNINIEAAGELIQRAMALEPDKPDYIDSLGWFHFRTGRFDKALETLLNAEELLAEPDPVVLDHIAQTYHELGDNENAIRYFKRSLALAPDDAEVQARLKMIEAQSAPVSTPSETAPSSAGAAPTPKKKAA